MLKLFKTKTENNIKDVSIENINQLPPFTMGFPSVTVDELIENKIEIIEQIKLILPLSKDEYDLLIIPIINNLAKFVHLLPASENHHHNGMSGLFSHSLETGYYASNAARVKRFTGPCINSIAPKDRARLEIKYQVACFIAGLVHDIGKPCSDLTVFDIESNSQWNWALETITDWMESNCVKHYYIQWNKNRHQNHHALGPIALKSVLTPELIKWLTEYGNNILIDIYKTCLNYDKSVFYEIVKKSDSKSVHNHLQFHAAFSIIRYQKSNDQHLIWAMRNLIDFDQWKINTPGSRAWIIEGFKGIFICWNEAVKDIQALLKKNEIYTIPKNDDDLADLLLERNIAIASPHMDSDKKLDPMITQRYWRVIPDGCGNKELLMLRISDARHIFPSFTPVAVAGFVNGQYFRADSINSIENSVNYENEDIKKSINFFKGSGTLGEFLIKIIKSKPELILEADEQFGIVTEIVDDEDLNKYLDSLLKSDWVATDPFRPLLKIQTINKNKVYLLKPFLNTHIKNLLTYYNASPSTPIVGKKKKLLTPYDHVNEYILRIMDSSNDYKFSISYQPDGIVEVSGDMLDYFLKKTELIISKSKLRSLIVTSPFFIKKHGNNYFFKKM